MENPNEKKTSAAENADACRMVALLVIVLIVIISSCSKKNQTGGINAQAFSTGSGLVLPLNTRNSTATTMSPTADIILKQKRSSRDGKAHHQKQ